MLKSGMDRLEIKEWRLELRENELCMEENNMKAKIMKLNELEETIDRQQQKRQEEQMVIDGKQRNFDVKEAEVDKGKEDDCSLHTDTEKIAVNSPSLSSAAGSTTEVGPASNGPNSSMPTEQQDMMVMRREQARILKVHVINNTF